MISMSDSKMTFNIENFIKFQNLINTDRIFLVWKSNNNHCFKTKSSNICDGMIWQICYLILCATTKCTQRDAVPETVFACFFLRTLCAITNNSHRDRYIIGIQIVECHLWSFCAEVNSKFTKWQMFYFIFLPCVILSQCTKH